MKAESSCCDDVIFLIYFFQLLLLSKEKVAVFPVLVCRETYFNHSSDLTLPSIPHSRILHQITVNIHSRTIHLFLLARWWMAACLRSSQEPQSASLSFLSNQSPKTCTPPSAHTHTYTTIQTHTHKLGVLICPSDSAVSETGCQREGICYRIDLAMQLGGNGNFSFHCSVILLSGEL